MIGDILYAIANKSMKQADIAKLYAEMIPKYIKLRYWWADVEIVNKAIITRWSLTGLKRIKKLAWAEWESREKEGGNTNA